MTDRPRAPRSSTRGPARWLRVAAAAAPTAVLVWLGCEVTPDNYEMLSMFFDGVPDPSKRAAVLGTEGAGETAAAFVHKPYLDEQCDACHSSRLSFTRRDASGCISCHAEVPTRHAYTHGPVAANACLWCHTPHESAFAHLLRESDRTLCTRCHAPSLLSTERVPEHADRSRACLDCHTGHGGDARFALRGAPASTGPAQGER